MHIRSNQTSREAAESIDTLTFHAGDGRGEGILEVQEQEDHYQWRPTLIFHAAKIKV